MDVGRVEMNFLDFLNYFAYDAFCLFHFFNDAFGCCVYFFLISGFLSVEFLLASCAMPFLVGAALSFRFTSCDILFALASLNSFCVGTRWRMGNFAPSVSSVNSLSPEFLDLSYSF